MSLYTNEDLLQMLDLPADQRDLNDVELFIPWLRSRCSTIDKLGEDVARDIIKNCTVEKRIPNEVIIRSGESGDSFYVILNGSVSVWLGKENEDNRSSGECPQIYMVHGRRMAKNKESFGNCLATLGIGQTFGELALINEDCIRMASVLADEQTRLVVINRSVFNRSLKEKKLREYREKLEFVNASIYFVNTPYRLRKDVAMSLQKETTYYGHTLVKQGECFTKLHFVLRGQLRLQLNSSALQQALTRKVPKTSDPPTYMNCKVKAIGQRSPAQSHGRCTVVQDVCLLSSGDCIGDLEVAANLTSITHTVIVEETATCFTLPVAAFDKLLRARSVKTMATFQKMATLRVEGRLNLSNKSCQTALLQDLLQRLQATFKDTCKGDKMLTRVIDVSLMRHRAGVCTFTEDRGPNQDDISQRGSRRYLSLCGGVAAVGRAARQPPPSTVKEAYNLLMRDATFRNCKPKRVHSAAPVSAIQHVSSLSKAMSMASLVQTPQPYDTEEITPLDQAQQAAIKREAEKYPGRVYTAKPEGMAAILREFPINVSHAIMMKKTITFPEINTLNGNSILQRAMY